MRTHFFRNRKETAETEKTAGTYKCSRTGRSRKLCLLLVLSLVLGLFGVQFPGTGTAYAYTQLAAPSPKLEGNYVVTWSRVEHAASYDVKLTMYNEDDEKTVSRTLSVKSLRVDLKLFAAGCRLTVNVRAVPSSKTSSQYKASAWKTLNTLIEPTDDNNVSAYASASGGKYYLAAEDGTKLTGWLKINRSWYYFDPANGNLTATGWKTINDSTYYFDEYGCMQTGWLAWEKHWYYLNPANTAEGKMVTGWFEVQPNKPYYFTETSSAEHPLGSLDEARTTAIYPANNPPYSLSSGSSTGATSGGTGTGTTGGNTAAGPGAGTSAVQTVSEWRQNPNGTWSYYRNGTQIKNGWALIDGFWYYFNASGTMLTGWQYINSAWYYLEPHTGGSNGYKCGAAWINTTTPDGYTVNTGGQWVRDGVVVTTGNGTANYTTGGSGSGSANSSANLRQISNCSISLSVTDSKGGRCRYASVGGASYCTVQSQSYSTAYENWTPGSTVTITVTLKANNGYTFINGTKFTCSGATVTGQSGSATERTVTLSYTPTSRLAAPETFYITDVNELKWIPVQYAKRYKVTITGGDLSSATTVYVTEPMVDLNTYGDIDSSVMNATVSAMSAEGNKTSLESEKATINDLGAYKQSHTLNGTFVLSEGKIKFKDDGEVALTGWQQLLGSWYHFRSTGWADGPGWYQDTDGNWYYFDSRYRMVTGSITENGTTYFLNDGSRSDLPLGAWVK